MTEHRGASFAHSCVKVPLDPYSRQPTPAYERPRTEKSILPTKSHSASLVTLPCGREEDRCSRMDNRILSELLSAREEHKLLEHVHRRDGDCHEDMHHLTNEQFKQKLDHLKRRQRMLLKNLRNCLEQADHDDAANNSCPLIQRDTTPSGKSEETTARACSKSPRGCTERNSLPTDLALKGRRCNLLEQDNSPPLGNFSCLAEDQDFLTYRRNDPELWLHRERGKAAKTLRNEKILSLDKCSVWSSGSESKSPADESDEPEVKVETKSLPSLSPERWQPTATKPFNFGLREDTEKYLSEQPELKQQPSKGRNPAKKRRMRPVPLTSKIPLYDKLMAEKEERSRIVREESALSLLSQVRPFKLECERRALRALSRSSPELGRTLTNSTGKRGPTRFKANPVPRGLFSADVYDRMLEEEYFRKLQKRIRASELLKSASLPPSMARRERCRSASCPRSRSAARSTASSRSRSCSSIAGNRGCCAPLLTEHSRCSALVSTLPIHGTNLAAILRAQAAREKLEREIQERLEEKRREQMLQMRKTLIGRKPAWRALRFAARHEHERDLDFRASLRRDEAREQAERHKLHMELMLDRVTRIPTLFERYSQDETLLQSFHRGRDSPTKGERISGRGKKKKKKKPVGQHQSSSSTESYISLNSNNNSRPSSGSLSSPTPPVCPWSGSLVSYRLAGTDKRKNNDRGPLKVSINETAELIEDEGSFSVDSASSRVREEREKRALLGGDAQEKE